MSQLVPIDEVCHFDVVTHNPSTGAVSDADSTPTFDVYEEATDTGLLGATNLTKRTSLTGNYRGTFTASAANGFEAGKWYMVIASATVNAIAGKAVAMHFRVAPAESSAGVPKVDVSHLGGGSQSLLDLKDFADDGYDPSTNKVQGVVLVDTATDLTNKGNGSGFTAIPWNASWDAEVQSEADDALAARGVTSARMGFVDNLNIGGNVASSAEATAIQNNTRVVRVVPDDIELPTAGTRTYRIELLLYDAVGNMEAPDSAPTIALVNQAGTDRSGRLDSATMALVETGRYRAIYTSTAGDTKEQLVWTFSVVEGGATRKYGNTSYVTDAVATDFTSADRAKLDTLHDTRLTAGRAANLDNLDAAITSRMATFVYTAPLDAAGTRAAVGLAAANLDTQLGDIPTNAELAASQAAADDATLAAIAGLSIPSAADNVTAIFAKLIEAGVTFEQLCRALGAAAAGKRSNSGTLTEQYDAINNPGTARIVPNADAAGDGTPALTL